MQGWADWSVRLPQVGMKPVAAECGPETGRLRKAAAKKIKLNQPIGAVKLHL